MSRVQMRYNAEVLRALVETGTNPIEAKGLALRATTLWTRAIEAKGDDLSDDAAEIELLQILARIGPKPSSGRSSLEDDVS